MGFCRGDMSSLEIASDLEAYTRLAEGLAGTGDAPGPDDPRHLLRLAGNVHLQLASMATQARLEGVPEGRAWELALEGLDAALAGREAVRAVAARPFDLPRMRELLPHPAPRVEKVRHVFAGYSEADFLSHNAHVFRHNMETSSRTYYAAKLGWDLEDAMAAWHRAAAVGRLQGSEFARAVDDLMGAAAVA